MEPNTAPAASKRPELLQIWLILMFIANSLAFLGYALFGSALHNFYPDAPAAGVTAVLYAALGIGILYVAMKPVWNEFK